MEQGENTAPVAGAARLGFMGKAKMALMALVLLFGAGAGVASVIWH